MVLAGQIKEIASCGGGDQDSEAEGYFTAGMIRRPADRLRRRPPARSKAGTDGVALYGTKSLSRALSCSVTPVVRAWKPVTWDRRLSRMRRTSPSIWNATQYAIFAHFGISSRTRNTARRFKLLTRLEFRRLPDSRNLEH